MVFLGDCRHSILARQTVFSGGLDFKVNIQHVKFDSRKALECSVLGKVF